MGSSLAHAMVVAGTRRDWQALSDPAWAELAQRLGKVVADAGGAWLTIRAYEAGDAGGDDLGPQRVLTTSDGRCTVIVDPETETVLRHAQAEAPGDTNLAVQRHVIAALLAGT